MMDLKTLRYLTSLQVREPCACGFHHAHPLDNCVHCTVLRPVPREFFAVEVPRFFRCVRQRSGWALAQVHWHTPGTMWFHLRGPTPVDALVSAAASWWFTHHDSPITARVLWRHR